MRTVIVALLIGLAATAGARAQEGPPRPAVSTVDAGLYAARTVLAHRFVVEAGRLALDRADLPALRDFAQKTIEDHEAAIARLAAALAASGEPEAPGALDPGRAAELAAMRALKGGAFDAAYTDAALAALRDLVDVQRRYARDGMSAALRAHAAEVLPLARSHLEHLRAIAGATSTG